MTPPIDDERSPLESPALGSSLASLIAPCGDALRPAPPPPADNTPIGITLSGGGFRATFAGLGVIRYLADAGLLHDLRYVSSVSGGSVANGMVATRWAQLRERDFTAAAVDELVIAPLVERVDVGLAQVEADPQRLAGGGATEPDRRAGVGVRRLVVRQDTARIARSGMPRGSSTPRI